MCHHFPDWPFRGFDPVHTLMLCFCLPYLFCILTPLPPSAGDESGPTRKLINKHNKRCLILLITWKWDSDPKKLIWCFGVINGLEQERHLFLNNTSFFFLKLLGRRIRLSVQQRHKVRFTIIDPWNYRHTRGAITSCPLNRCPWDGDDGGFVMSPGFCITSPGFGLECSFPANGSMDSQGAVDARMHLSMTQNSYIITGKEMLKNSRVA